MGYVGLVYMFLADWLFFTLDVTLMQMGGILICLACTLGVVVYKMTRPKDKSEMEASDP